MDFLDPVKRRRQRRQILIGYVLVGIAIVMASLILVYQAYGYGVDTSTGGIVTNGLLFIDSKPSGADIYLNGQIKGKSADRYVLPSGTYTMTLKKDGYRDWMRTISLEGHSLERFVYPFLFPKTITPKTYKTYPSQPLLLTQSPDRRWLIELSKNKNIISGEQVDANATELPSAPLNVPTELFSGLATTTTMKMVEWSTDNKNFIVRHNFAGGSEYVVINRDSPELSFNVNKLFNISPTSVALHDKKADQLYVLLADKSLRLVTVKDKSVSPPVLQKVEAFKPYGDKLVLFATPDTQNPATTAFKILDDTTVYKLYDIAAAPSYLLDLAQFQNHWYYAIGGVGQERVELFKDPLDTIKQPAGVPKPFLALRSSNNQALSFSANTRFIAVQGSAYNAVYDIEYDRNFRYPLPMPLVEPAQWMDGHRLMGMNTNQVVVYDYDGTNKQLLAPSILPIGGFFDRDYNRLFTMETVGAGPSTTINYSEMRAGKDLPQSLQ